MTICYHCSHLFNRVGILLPFIWLMPPIDNSFTAVFLVLGHCSSVLSKLSITLAMTTKPSYLLLYLIAHSTVWLLSFNSHPTDIVNEITTPLCHQASLYIPSMSKPLLLLSPSLTIFNLDSVVEAECSIRVNQVTFESGSVPLKLEVSKLSVECNQ